VPSLPPFPARPSPAPASALHNVGVQVQQVHAALGQDGLDCWIVALVRTLWTVFKGRCFPPPPSLFSVLPLPLPHPLLSRSLSFFAWCFDPVAFSSLCARHRTLPWNDNHHSAETRPRSQRARAQSQTHRPSPPSSPAALFSRPKKQEERARVARPSARLGNRRPICTSRCSCASRPAVSVRARARSHR
jgi:hypothetical protein